MIKEVGPDTYRSTKLSRALIDPKMIDGIANSFVILLICLCRLMLKDPY